MEYKFSKEDRVFITLKNGVSYEGDVKSYSETYQRLSLKNIIERPRNVAIEGCRHFECSEISHMDVLPLQHCSASTTTGDTLKDNDNQDVFVNCSISRKISDSEYNRILDLRNSFHFIDSSTSNLDSAISKLQESDVIGLYGKDTSKGRSERASVIALSTNADIFIFDLAILGDKIFDKGLREVLQSEFIKKVVYDCRLLSDCLFHKHQVKLVNIRDVEAEDIMVVHQERGCIRKHNRPFDYLVETYLGIGGEALNETDLPDSWQERPLSSAHIKCLAAYASFLIPLHEAIEWQFLQRLINASKIYNEYLRDSDMYEFVTEDCRYVFRKQFIELVKNKNTCRGIKKCLT